MRKYLIAPALIAAATPALADEIKLKPIIDARLRYEHVDQAGIVEEANAITLRLRSGIEAKSGPFAVLAEAEGTIAVSNQYNSGLNGKGTFPIVADPESIGLNRLQMQFTGLKKTVITVGRQRLNLDDQRFVGSVGWRQNEQTLDAVRVEYSGIKNLKADVTYAWKVHTIWGSEGFGARQTAIDGDNILANVSYKGKNWGLTGFAYVVDQDEFDVQSFRLSSQTYGMRANATVPLGKKVKLNLLTSYARQSDHNRNPVNYAADYWLGEASVDYSGFKLTGGYEVLGATTGVGFSTFQTPLATLHKFNGTADKFLTTPANGLTDLYIGLAKTFPKVKAVPGLNANVTWHRFRSERLGLTYGDEWNAQAGFKIGKKLAVLAKFAHYDQKGTPDFAGDADTTKFWFQIDYIL